MSRRASVLAAHVRIPAVTRAGGRPSPAESREIRPSVTGPRLSATGPRPFATDRKPSAKTTVRDLGARPAVAVMAIRISKHAMPRRYDAGCVGTFERPKSGVRG